MRDFFYTSQSHPLDSGLVSAASCAPATFSDAKKGPTPQPPQGIQFISPASYTVVTGHYFASPKCKILDNKEDNATSLNCAFYTNKDKTAQPFYDVKVSQFSAHKKLGGADLIPSKKELINGVETHNVSLSLADMEKYDSLIPVLEDRPEAESLALFEPIAVDADLVNEARREDKEYVQYTQKLAYTQNDKSFNHLFAMDNKGNPYILDADISAPLFNAPVICTENTILFNAQKDRCLTLDAAFVADKTECPPSFAGSGVAILPLFNGGCAKIARKTHRQQ